MKTTLCRTVGLLAPLAILAPLSSFAQINRLDQVIVTANRAPERLGDVLADVTVFDRAQIERQFTGSIADLLVANGCAELSQTGGPTATTSLFLRGADSRHTVVLVDGVRVDSQASNGASWQAMPLAQIERVEVLKGPASAVYGSDAVGGVVQIFTRKAGAKPIVELGMAAGNLGSFKADGLISGGDAAFDYALSASGEHSKGFNATTPANIYSYIPDRDGWRTGNASLRVGGQLAPGHRLEFVGLTSHANTQYDASAYTPQADDHAIQDNRVARLAWSANWSPALHTELSVGQSSDRYATESFNNPYPYPYLAETRLRNVALLGNWRVDGANQLNFQLERREDRLENTDLPGGQDNRANNAAALGWLFKQGAFDLQAHGRHDSDSQYGGVNTGTLATGYSLADGWRAYASVGNAFRAPTLYQRGSTYGPDLSKPGVAALEPERGHNKEIGLRWDGDTAGFAATVYRNDVSDLIAFGAAGTCKSPYGCYVNVDRARLEGLSLDGNAQLGGLNLSGSLNLQNPANLATDSRLARRARQYGHLRVDTVLAGWTLGANAQFNGQRFDDAGNTRSLGGYTLLNIDAAYALSAEWKLQLKLDNAFDKDHTLAYGYATTPRLYYVGLRYALK
ncbi:MAG: TonB-dependent receptor [Paucibacter sp.]|nr:TonB-dependent receptor [Roseateles sp.]